MPELKDMQYLSSCGNFEYYFDGLIVWSVAKPGSGCTTTVFGSMKHYKKVYPDTKKPSTDSPQHDARHGSTDYFRQYTRPSSGTVDDSGD